MVVLRLPAALLAVLALLALVPSEAQAQQDDPVGPFVIDARVALPSFSAADSIAAPLGLRGDQLPERGTGFEIGAHVYPLRGRRLSLGIGASLVRASGKQAPGEEAEATDTTIETRFSTLTPQLSLNFGSTRGWSYIAAGYGPTRRITFPAESTAPDGVNLYAVSYGGGARWFLSTHVAFSFDLRFYRLPAQTADVGVPASPGYTMFMGAAGISIK